jgi:tetratricopeptide (TPR) repeat protein
MFYTCKRKLNPKKTPQRMRLLIFAIIVCNPLFLFSQQTSKADKAYSLFEKEDYGAALKEVNVLIDQDSTIGEYHILRAKIYARQRKFDKAFAEYDNAVSKEPVNYKMYAERGLFYYSTQNPDLALTDYNLALKYFNDKDTIKYHIINDRGTASLMKRDFETALEDFLTVLKFDSTEVSALSNAGTVLGQMGRPNEAKPHLEKLIRLYPDNIFGYLNLGFVNERTGDYAKAISLYNKVLQIDPKDARSFNNRGFCKFKMDDIAGALTDINRSIELYPENSYAFKNRAVVYLSKNELKKACADLNKAVQLGFSEMYGTEVYLLLQQHCK